MRNIGDLKFYCYDFDEIITVMDYFHALLIELWSEGQYYSYDGWKNNVHDALLDNGIIEGERDEEDKYWKKYNKKEANKIILEYLKADFRK